MAEGEFTLWICPVCGEQADWDPEYGAGHWHDGRDVDAIEVDAAPIDPGPAIGLARFRLAQEQRELDFRAAEDRVWWNLPEEERERIIEEKRAKMDPMTRALYDMVNETSPLLGLARRGWPE